MLFIFQANLSSQSFLSDSCLINESVQWLQSQDTDLVSCLTVALASTHTDDIDLIDDSATDQVDHSRIPSLLQAIISQNKGLFQQKREFAGMFRPQISSQLIKQDDNTSNMTLNTDLGITGNTDSESHRDLEVCYNSDCVPLSKKHKKKKKKHIEKNIDCRSLGKDDRKEAQEKYSILHAGSVKLKLKLPRLENVTNESYGCSSTQQQVGFCQEDSSKMPTLTYCGGGSSGDGCNDDNDNNGDGGSGSHLPSQPPALPNTPMFRSTILGTALPLPQSLTQNFNGYGIGASGGASPATAWGLTSSDDLSNLIPLCADSLICGGGSDAMLDQTTSKLTASASKLLNMDTRINNSDGVPQLMAFGENWPDLTSQLPSISAGCKNGSTLPNSSTRVGLGPATTSMPSDALDKSNALYAKEQQLFRCQQGEYSPSPPSLQQLFPGRKQHFLILIVLHSTKLLRINLLNTIFCCCQCYL